MIFLASLAEAAGSECHLQREISQRERFGNFGSLPGLKAGIFPSVSDAGGGCSVRMSVP